MTTTKTPEARFVRLGMIMVLAQRSDFCVTFARDLICRTNSRDGFEHQALRLLHITRAECGAERRVWKIVVTNVMNHCQLCRIFVCSLEFEMAIRPLPSIDYRFGNAAIYRSKVFAAAKWEHAL